MAGKIRGISQAKANLEKLIADVQGRKAIRAIKSALIIGSS
ncbi:HK97 gp10 family phage protein, partial [Cronobacter sakazakii]|nr:HK97 gp10 family phage protein [Cronobacter sakazakii]